QFKTGINGATLNKINNFATTIKTFQVLISQQNAFDAGNQIASSSGLLKEFYADKSIEGLSRYENIQELLAGLKEFSENQKEQGLPDKLPDFMNDVALLTDQDENDKDNNDKVSLMTIHAAKGLEFPYVFVAGLE